MADSSVLLEVIVEGKNIKLVQRSVEELGDSINKSSSATEKDTKSKKKNKKATDDLAAGQKNFNKGQKGVAGATANGTKAFSKQREAIGGGSSGLVGAYATLAANIFAATAAFGALQRAAQFEKLLDGFETIAATSGRTSSIVVQSLREITDGALSTEQAASAAAAGINAGFSNLDLERLAGVAKNAAVALGRNIPDAIDRVIRGTAKLEPEILDELGIFVRLDDAVETYATQLGKSASQLTNTERRQAFLNATLEQGETKFAAIAGAVQPDQYTKLAAAFDDLTKSLLGFFSGVVGPFISLLANNTGALIGTLVLFGSTIVGQIFPVLTKLGDKFIAASAKAAEAAEEIKNSTEESLNAKLDVLKKDTPVGEDTNFGKVRQKALKGEVLTTKELKDANTSLGRSITARTTAIKKLENIEGELTKEQKKQLKLERKNLEVVKEQKKATMELLNAERARAIAAKRAERAAAPGKREGAVGERIGEIQGGGAFEGFGKASEGFKDYKSKVKDITIENRKAARSSKTLGLAKGILGKNFIKVTKTIAGIKTGFQIASVGVRLFGAAVINAIPLIGQIIFVVGILIEQGINLYKKLVPTNKGIETLGEISEASAKKAETLTQTTTNYTAALRKQAMAKELEAQASGTSENGQVGLTSAVLEGIDAQIKARVEARKYREELKVVAGSFGEISDAFQQANSDISEVAENENFITKFALFIRTLDIVKQKVKDFITEFIASFNISERLAPFIQVIGNLKDSTVGFISDIIDTIVELQDVIKNKAADAFNFFVGLLPESVAERIRSGVATVSEVAGAAADALASAKNSAVATASEIADATTELANDVKKGIVKVAEGVQEIAGEARADQVADRTAAEAIKRIEALAETIEETGAALPLFAKRVETEFKGGVIKVFNDLVSSGLSAEEALRQIELRFEKVRLSAEKSSRTIESVEEEFAALSEQSNKFLSKFDKKNPLTDLDSAARSAVQSVANLKKQLDLNEDGLAGNAAIAAAFRAQVAELGIDFERFGLTLEQVQDQGPAAFNGLINSLTTYNTAVKESANETKRLKAELATLKIDFDAEKSVREFNAKLSGLVETGKFEVTVGDQLKVRLENIEAEKKFLEAKKKIENDLITQQYAVIKAELSVAEALLGAAEAITNAANGGTAGTAAEASGSTAEGSTGGSTAAGTAAGTEGGMTTQERRVADIAAQRRDIEDAEQAARDNIDRQTTESINRLNEAAIAAQIQQTEKIVAAAGQGDTAEDRSQNFFAAGGFEGIGKAAGVAKGAVEANAEADADKARKELAAGSEELKKKLEEIEEAKTKAFANIDTQAFQAGLEATNAQLQPMIDNLKSLGPEGELVAAITEGAFQMADSFAVLGNKGADTADKIAAIGGILNAIGSIAKASSDARIAGIDKEIAAEKKRDGKSKESLAKIKELEAKKEREKKKAFERDKKIKMATVIIDTAAAVVRALAEGGPILGPILAAAMVALGAAQLAIISGTSYQGGGSTPSAPSSPNKVEVGKRRSTVDLSKSQSSSGELGYLRGAQGVGGPENFRPAFMGAQYRAMGGATTGYVVGEQGPELFVPDTPGTVVPNSDLEEVAPINATININAIDSTGVAQVLEGQRGNIIGMLRESANSYGDVFFEDVETAIYTDQTRGAERA